MSILRGPDDAQEEHGPLHLATHRADIILIDEISRCSRRSAASITHSPSCHESNAISIVSPSGGPFGCKSVVTLGDPYQLPAIEGIRFEDQVYSSILWGYFRFIELTESCRTDATEVEFAALLSLARIGWAGVDNAVREADEALLKTRLCTEHCACNDDGVRLLEPFDDVEPCGASQIRTAWRWQANSQSGSYSQQFLCRQVKRRPVSPGFRCRDPHKPWHYR
jgi:hypothetical protein